MEWAENTEPSILSLGEDLPLAAEASKLGLDDLKKEVCLVAATRLRVFTLFSSIFYGSFFPLRCVFRDQDVRKWWRDKCPYGVGIIVFLTAPFSSSRHCLISAALDGGLSSP